MYFFFFFILGITRLLAARGPGSRDDQVICHATSTGEVIGCYTSRYMYSIGGFNALVLFLDMNIFVGRFGGVMCQGTDNGIACRA